MCSEYVMCMYVYVGNAIAMQMFNMGVVAEQI